MAGAEHSASRAGVTVCITEREIGMLVRIAYYYLSLRPIRFLVRVTARGEMRVRAQFIADESRWLRQFAKNTRNDMRDAGETEREIHFTSRALVAFWGRLLSSTNTPRSRRKMSQLEMDRRVALAAKLEEGARVLARRNRAQLESDLQTRRPAEEIWMRERLGLPAKKPAAPSLTPELGQTSS